MINYEEVAKRQVDEGASLLSIYESNKPRLHGYNLRPNNCANVVRAFLTAAGVSTPKLTAWADTIRSLGEVQRNPWALRVGDVVAMGRPGDTRHVGIYMGSDKVLHQSGVRGYRVGIYYDLAAFVNHRAGFYFVRPHYPLAPLSPEVVMTAPALTD